MPQIHLLDLRPVAAYNADKQELVGIFRTHKTIARYFLKDTYKNYSGISTALRKKTRLISKLGFKLALRYANAAQLEILGDEEFVILGDYSQPDKSILNGFHETRRSLHKECEYKRSILLKEKRRKNGNNNITRPKEVE